MCQFTCLHLLISAQCKGQLLHFAHDCKYILVKNNETVQPMKNAKIPSVLFSMCCNIRFPSCLFSILFPLRSEVSLPQNTSEYRNIYTFSTFSFLNMKHSHLNYRWEDFCCMFSNFDCRCKRFYCISTTNLVKDETILSPLSNQTGQGMAKRPVVTLPERQRSCVHVPAS